MNVKCICILAILICTEQCIYAQIGLEQYCYLQHNGNTTQVQLIHYQNSKNWYIEARYNYEDQNTGALYIGRTFVKEGKLSFSITPLLGGVAGRFMGGSAGFNGTADFKNFYFSTQTQYTFSAEDETTDYFFSWSEVGYEFYSWLYAGIACQQTNLFKTKTQFEPGVALGFVIGKLSFPLYAFSPFTDGEYYVLGINLTIDVKSKITR